MGGIWLTSRAKNYSYKPARKRQSILHPACFLCLFGSNTRFPEGHPPNRIAFWHVFHENASLFCILPASSAFSVQTLGFQRDILEIEQDLGVFSAKTLVYSASCCFLRLFGANMRFPEGCHRNFRSVPNLGGADRNRLRLWATLGRISILFRILGERIEIDYDFA